MLYRTTLKFIYFYFYTQQLTLLENQKYTGEICDVYDFCRSSPIIFYINLSCSFHFTFQNFHLPFMLSLHKLFPSLFLTNNFFSFFTLLLTAQRISLLDSYLIQTLNYYFSLVLPTLQGRFLPWCISFVFRG